MSESENIEPNYDCNNILPIDWEPNKVFFWLPRQSEGPVFKTIKISRNNAASLTI